MTCSSRVVPNEPVYYPRNGDAVRPYQTAVVRYSNEHIQKVLLMSRFRILALDGGGIKGTFSAAALAALEDATGHRCVEHFDLITGTSTGGIIAIGLGLGMTAQQIVSFYEEHGPVIFPGSSLVQRAAGTVRQLIWGPKHSHQVLRERLTTVLGTRKFGESTCRLAIPTYDAIGGRVFVMKTAHHPRFRFDIDAPAVDVALATSAAPTYFQAAHFPKHGNASYVDGGVWANSPVLVGLVEAVSFLNAALDDIDILSIGTTTTPFSIAKHATSGALEWNMGLVNLMFEAQVEAALAQATLLTKGRLHRIDTTASAGDFSLDDAQPEKIRQLVSRGRAEAVKKEHLEFVQEVFLNGNAAEPFRPCS
jgi:patatin-like phospholipase/acyl hydrolase